MAERWPVIAANWKMHKTHLEAIQAVQQVSYLLDHDDAERVEVVICPAFTALRSVGTLIESDRLPFGLGAQDVHPEEKGAFTGEVAPGMLSALGCTYVIVGHSERRQLFGETDATVSKKVRAVFATGMTPILCVGETLEEREAREHPRVHGPSRDRRRAGGRGEPGPGGVRADREVPRVAGCGSSSTCAWMGWATTRSPSWTGRRRWRPRGRRTWTRWRPGGA